MCLLICTEWLCSTEWVFSTFLSLAKTQGADLGLRDCSGHLDNWSLTGWLISTFLKSRDCQSGVFCTVWGAINQRRRKRRRSGIAISPPNSFHSLLHVSLRRLHCKGQAVWRQREWWNTHTQAENGPAMNDFSSAWPWHMTCQKLLAAISDQGANMSERILCVQPKNLAFYSNCLKDHRQSIHGWFRQ